VRTLFRRLQDPEYRQQIKDLRYDMMDRALGQLTSVTLDAVRTLSELLSSESEHARLGAARTILEHVSRLRETVELESRIRALEVQAT
jgi:hypothetical protein